MKKIEEEQVIHTYLLVVRVVLLNIHNIILQYSVCYILRCDLNTTQDVRSYKSFKSFIDPKAQGVRETNMFAGVRDLFFIHPDAKSMSIFIFSQYISLKTNIFKESLKRNRLTDFVMPLIDKFTIFLAFFGIIFTYFPNIPEI